MLAAASFFDVACLNCSAARLCADPLRFVSSPHVRPVRMRPALGPLLDCGRLGPDDKTARAMICCTTAVQSTHRPLLEATPGLGLDLPAPAFRRFPTQYNWTSL